MGDEATGVGGTSELPPPEGGQRKPIVKVLCAGGCGKTQGWTEQDKVDRHKLYCRDCSQKIPRPMMRNIDPVQKGLKEVAEQIEQGKISTAQAILQVVNLISQQQKRS